MSHNYDEKSFEKDFQSFKAFKDYLNSRDSGSNSENEIVQDENVKKHQIQRYHFVCVGTAAVSMLQSACCSKVLQRIFCE